MKSLVLQLLIDRYLAPKAWNDDWIVIFCFYYRAVYTVCVIAWRLFYGFTGADSNTCMHTSFVLH